ncbi:unnamed protein product [Brachionus calyciflorus]|uniref:Reticulocalbin-3 n=1 Tax=Brachionus calyciflorus TaxID=104777 RepID=A0A813Q1P5_9BILA|nr:unnamed protein product [Brachionus calyciflorus]
MKFLIISVVLVVSIFLSNCSVLNKDEERTHTHKLSEEAHYKDTNGDKVFEHNVDYDHEAFLGKEEAEKFKALTPEESKERLGKIIEKIDSDHDEFVNETELYEWLHNVTRSALNKETDEKWKLFGENTTLDEYLETNFGALKYYRNHDSFINVNELRIWIRQQHKLDLQKEADKKWKKVNTNQDSYLTFDELIENTIGAHETWSEEEKTTRKELYQAYLKMMERDKKRFKAADIDNDGKLSRAEYSDFIHPEESKTMRNLVIDETIEDLDKNGDGVISFEEFVTDLKKNVKDGEDEPEWISVEVENFRSFRDKNKDNVLDREEINDWILPADYDYTLNEAKHLVFEADDNKDGKLSKKEILDNYNLFVASSATNYGKKIYDKEDL